ncbi:MAG: serine/threonine-protein kinase [Myxococcota bacterium]
MSELDATTPSGGGTYRHLMRLSEGGMGLVDLCVREGGRFRRLYAMKRLKPSIREDESCRSMFIEEARLAGLVHHPNVVSVLDVGEDRDGPFLVMEYVDGVTANDLLRHARRSGVLLPVSVVVDVVAQAAAGLAEAHDQAGYDGKPLELVHRDVSPHNLLIGHNGVVRVTDFGIARATGTSHQTSTGILKGKLGYMAPEVLQFTPADARTDIFALGVVMFELLAGRRLYSGDDHERAKRIVKEPPPDIGEERDDVPPAVQALLVAMLAKDPDERPQRASDVAARLVGVHAELRASDSYVSLRDCVEEEFATAREERQIRIQRTIDEAAAKRATPTKKWLRPAAAAALVLSVAALVAFALRSDDPGPETVRAASQTAAMVPVQPPAVEAEAAPATVEVRIESTPPARVTGPDIDEQTPAVLTLARSDEPIELVLRRSGYRARTVPITPNADARLELRLDRVRRRRPRRTRTSMMTPDRLNKIWD